MKIEARSRSNNKGRRLSLAGTTPLSSKCLLSLFVLLACHIFLKSTRYFYSVIGHYEIMKEKEIVAPRPNMNELEIFSVDLDHVLKTQETPNHPSDNPPAEHAWLLPSIDHPPPIPQIPRIVNKMYFQRDGRFLDLVNASENLIAAHKSWPEMNPGYSIRYFNMRLAREYLRKYFHPIFIRTFDCIQAFAGKANFFRMVLLYRDGGWHSDWKQVCLIPNLLDTISNGTDFFASHDTALDWGGKEGKCSQNAFVGARPRHPAIAKTIEKIMRNVQNMYYGRSAWETTGPCVLGSAIHEAGYEFSKGFKFVLHHHDSDIIHFFWNNEKIVRHVCKDCPTRRNWVGLGNDYVAIWEKKNYYCEDANSLFDVVADDEAMEINQMEIDTPATKRKRFREVKTDADIVKKKSLSTVIDQDYNGKEIFSWKKKTA